MQCSCENNPKLGPQNQPQQSHTGDFQLIELDVQVWLI